MHEGRTCEKHHNHFLTCVEFQVHNVGLGPHSFIVSLNFVGHKNVMRAIERTPRQKSFVDQRQKRLSITFPSSLEKKLNHKYILSHVLRSIRRRVSWFISLLAKGVHGRDPYMRFAQEQFRNSALNNSARAPKDGSLLPDTVADLPQMCCLLCFKEVVRSR